MASKLESPDELIDRMAAGSPVRARKMRDAIDREGVAKNILVLDGEYKKRYDAFVAAVEAADKEAKVTFQGDTFTKASAQKIINTVEGQGEASERLKYREMGESDRDLMGKLFSDLQGIVQAGHRDISILLGQMALLLKKLPQDDPRRPALRALFLITKQIDAVTEDTELSLEELIEKNKELIESDYDITADVDITVNAIKGIDGEVTFILENLVGNQEKGRKYSARVGKVFQKVVQSDTRSFEKLFSGYDISKLRGSPNIQELIGSQIRDILDPKVVGFTPGTVSPGSKTKRVKNKATSASGSALKSASLKKHTLRKRAKRKKQRGAMESPIKLIALINAKLPETVAKNMGAPRLENRTGRFASSPRVVDVTTTKGGFPSFGYTYEKSPYSVFESTSGSRFASTDRDPRDLIQLSIREIATQFSIGRFYTRRV